MVEFIPQKCFKSFGESVSNARRKGDLDPAEEINATTYKLVGNSFYGKTITNKEKHQNVSYVDGDDKASQRVRRTKFVTMEELGEEFYEIVNKKEKVNLL